MSGSPEVTPGTQRTLRSSAKNPRRRQRQSDPDSVKTAPRRKRSKISENTFAPPRHDEEEEEVNGTIEVSMMNGDVQPESPRRGRGRPRKEASPRVEIEIPVRSKRSSLKRPTRGDGSSTLTQTTRYSVKLLPSTPKDLTREGVEWRGSLAGHLALAVTRTRAYIWNYTAHASSPKVFDIPFLVKSTDALPFGALVTTGTSTDVGLVLISAASGKVVFYESIERAASLGLFQERSVGVEGSLGSLFSGEAVVDITSAQHAGFIVTLSSGRLFQLMLRDGQGRARITSLSLRATDQTSNGFFGSIKGLLSAGAWRRDAATVHTRKLGPRGQVQAISLTERAELLVWDLDYTGQNTFKGALDFREVMTHELQKIAPPERTSMYDDLTALDFAILERSSNSNEIATVGTGLALDFLVLLRAGRPDECRYVIATVTIEGQKVVVPQLQPLETYHHNPLTGPSKQPTILLPAPRHTAIITFDDAIVFKELDKSDANSPEAQLHASYIQPSAFEESIYLKQSNSLAIVGAYEDDDKTNTESAIVFVQGAGLARLAAPGPTSTETADRQDRVPVKRKIEQAVFRGALQAGNILDLSRVTNGSYSPDDVESAALEISTEILRSTSPFVSKAPHSMESHLAYKAQALRALIDHVRQSYPTLSKTAAWQLLCNAERVTAAQQLWKMFEDHVAACDKSKRISTILDTVCTMANEEAEGGLETNSGDDAVRTFFIHRLHRLDKLLIIAEIVLRALKNDQERTPQSKVRLVSEADDLWNQTLETVFTFRMDNAATYGILPELLNDGVLKDAAEYVDLPEFWTSTISMMKTADRMPRLSRNFAKEEFEDGSNEELAALAEVIQGVNEQNPRLIHSMCLIYRERINWLASRSTDRHREGAEHLRHKFDQERHDHLRELADIAQASAGMQLAEKYRDMQTLTEMVVAEMQFSIEAMLDANEQGEGQASIVQYIAGITARIGGYFDRFGDDWANAYFDEGFSGSHAGVMLRDAQENWQPTLNKYLRADPSRAKLCWIDDLTAGKDFRHATESLLIAGKDQETRTWAKKVELSICKLSLLAMQEESAEKGTAMTESDLHHLSPEGELQLVSTQQRLYQHLIPEIRHCIDRQAELEVAMKKYGRKNQDLHALKQLLQTYLDRVLDRVALTVDELIDVLTLMEQISAEDGDDKNLQGSEFFLAIKALNTAAPHLQQDQFETLLQLIWKRCYVYDDWFEINSGSKQSDDATSQRLKDTAAWRTLHYASESGFLNAPDCHVRYLPPSECLGAGCRPEDLSYRWSNQDILDPILQNNRTMDEQLQSYVTDLRLDEWIEACMADVSKTLDAEAEEISRSRERERDFEAAVHEAGYNRNKANGHIPNGTLKAGFDEEDGSFLGIDADADAEADVEME